MFKKTPSAELTALDNAIDKIYFEMDLVKSHTDEYDMMSDQLVKLMKLKEEVSSGKRISPDVMAGIVANIGGILLILQYERVHVVASKALSFVSKLR